MKLLRTFILCTLIGFGMNTPGFARAYTVEEILTLFPEIKALKSGPQSLCRDASLYEITVKGRSYYVNYCSYERKDGNRDSLGKAFQKQPAFKAIKGKLSPQFSHPVISYRLEGMKDVSFALSLIPVAGDVTDLDLNIPLSAILESAKGLGASVPSQYAYRPSEGEKFSKKLQNGKNLELRFVKFSGYEDKTFGDLVAEFPELRTVKTRDVTQGIKSLKVVTFLPNLSKNPKVPTLSPTLDPVFKTRGIELVISLREHED